MQTLDFNAKHDINYCIATELRDEQIRINLKKVDGRLQPSEALRTEPIAVVCFGPSLVDTWEQIKSFKYIMSCSGAHQFLMARGITPTWHVELEPREYKAQLLGKPNAETEYLIASTIHPSYLDALAGHKVKLWHIFANETDAAGVLPRGEWALTGGSSVGLRCMTMARFLGFRDLHIFGMDGNVRLSGQTHGAQHPNPPTEKHLSETEYNGKKYHTTPSWLFCAKETFKELNQMPDVKATFYGEGLVQAMAKNYQPTHTPAANIAYARPELISPEYAALNTRLHQENPAYGMGGSAYKDIVLALSRELKTTAILDYGAGKQMLAKSLPFPIWSYDPAVAEIAAAPKPADIVICTDVLEHIEPEKLPFVLDDLRRCTLKAGYFVIHTGPAIKTYADGRNAHLIQKDATWWSKQLGKYFAIGKLDERGNHLHYVVGKKEEALKAPPAIAEVKNGDATCKFYTPNDTTAWRARTLLTKEPATTAWVNSMNPGDVLYDIGANVGGYTMLAGVRGVKVISFEPEAGNYALLCRNIELNKIDATAYCLALSDRTGLSSLYLASTEVGGSCNSFGEQVGFDLRERKGIKQGAAGVALDEIRNDLPAPTHIKIDVDGFEHKVIAGMRVLLEGSSSVQSLLIEVNSNLPQHQQMIADFAEMGYHHDQAQFNEAARKDGPFKGCGECIFTRRQAVARRNDADDFDDLCSKIAAAPIIEAPFPHIYIEDVFQRRWLDELNFAEEGYQSLESARGTKGYPQRSVKEAPLFFQQLCNGRLREILNKKFGAHATRDEICMLRDAPGYTIPPHTDAPHKCVTALFYVTPNWTIEEHGTTLYAPLIDGYTDPQGKHHNAKGFTPVWTAPGKPNSVLIFARSDVSFHGAQPYTGHKHRHILLWDSQR
jgi:FkbM family methyltransferase